MDELVKLVAQKAKIPEASAKVAVDTVVKLDDLIAGKGVEGLMKGLGGLLK